MTARLRFGKKIPLPSTLEIKHELRLMEAADALRAAASDGDIDAIVRDLADKIGLSKDRAQMLVDRFGQAGSTAGAA